MAFPPFQLPSALLTALCLLLSACGPAPGVNLAISDKARLTASSAPAADLRALTAGNNAFALDLYQTLRGIDGNLIFSPFSISLALGMTYAGARGETEAEMARALHFDLPEEQLHRAFNQLDLLLASQPETSDEEQRLQLRLANAVWAEETFAFLPEYLDVLALHYGAGVHLADFIREYEAARREINRWVSDQTQDRINDLLPEGVLSSDTRMVLVNAIYFKADWLSQFDKDSTHAAAFHLLDGSEIQVETMSQGIHVPYVDGEGYQAIELQYAGGTAAMDIIVPDTGTFTDFEASLDRARLDGVLSGLQDSSVLLSLPKFTFSGDFNLSDALADLGMPLAFDPERADFSGMTGARDLFITDVVHKAFVAVDEQGTEAAAATGVIMGVTSAPAFEITLNVDRPFIFLIRHSESEQILFIGRVLDPS